MRSTRKSPRGEEVGGSSCGRSYLSSRTAQILLAGCACTCIYGIATGITETAVFAVMTSSSQQDRLPTISASTTLAATAIRAKYESENNDGLRRDDDLHGSHMAVLEFVDWERQSWQALIAQNASRSSIQSQCRPPPGVPQKCCVGAFSTGGDIGLGFIEQCKHSMTPPRLQRLKDQVQLYLQSNPVLPTKNTSNEDTKEARICDLCQIVEILHQQNLTLSLLGDSMHNQVIAGLQCELARRNYTVEETLIYQENIPNRNVYRGFLQTRQFTIRSPTWATNGDKQEVVLYNHLVYMFPMTDFALDREKLDNVWRTSDIVMLGAGLHWWYEDRGLPFKSQASYTSAMKELLTNITNGGVRLVTHRETSAQHFDVPGGEYSLWNPIRTSRSSKCQPMGNHDSVYWRERAVQKAAQQAGYHVVVAGPHMLPKTNVVRTPENTFVASPTDVPELVVLPYFYFTAQFHDLHPDSDGDLPDCTHYCASPYLYMPIWRAFRLAVDREFG